MRRLPTGTSLTRTLLVAALAAAAVLIGLPGGAPSAAAHDTVVGTEPTDGAVLDASPAEIRLELSAEPLAISPQVVVSAGDRVVADLVPQVAGTTVVAALADPLPAGDYRVAWRVVSSDGHPIEGTFGFAVTGPEPAANPTASAAPTSSAAPAATPPGAVVATPGATPTTDAAPPAGGGIDPARAGLWVAAATLLAGIVVLVLRLRGRR